MTRFLNSQFVQADFSFGSALSFYGQFWSTGVEDGSLIIVHCNCLNCGKRSRILLRHPPAGYDTRLLNGKGQPPTGSVWKHGVGSCAILSVQGVTYAKSASANIPTIWEPKIGMVKAASIWWPSPTKKKLEKFVDAPVSPIWMRVPPSMGKTSVLNR